jgi:hypothetical protein
MSPTPSSSCAGHRERDAPLQDVGGLGGEGIFTKELTWPYRPGEQLAGLATLAPTLMFEVLVTGGSARKIA